MNPKERLCKELEQIAHLRAASNLLYWDQQTSVPSGAEEARANQFATINSVIHERLTGDKVKEPLGELVDLDTGEIKADLDPEEQRLATEIWQDYHKAVALPSSFVEEHARTVSISENTWRKARQANDFSLLLPKLEEVVELTRRKVQYLGVKTTPYDVLLDEFEPGMTSAKIERIFLEAKPSLVFLTQQITSSGVSPREEILHQDYDPEIQWDFTCSVLKEIGFDFNCGILSKSVHPLTQELHPTDVRITTRVKRHDLIEALFGGIHEAGHAMYEQGLDAKWFGTPFAQAISYGVHESQSRLWENLIGRSKEFWQYYYPKLQGAFPANLGNVSLEDFHRAINTVKPSLIRTEADEVTYNLHVMLRFELEKMLFNENLPVSELPRLWNEKMHEYLGIRPDSDANGVMQDIHWPGGAFGYFPSYSLGNFYGVQMLEQAKKDMPDLDSQIRQGQFRGLRDWLRTNIHRVGRRKTAPELIADLTGKELSARPFLEYLTGKYSEIYCI
jgi:carboxypeptidase Taq